MPRFSYLAVDNAGREVRGFLVGPSPQWVNEHLSDNSLVPVEVESSEEQQGWVEELRGHFPVSGEDLSMFSSQFAIMLDSGMPILASLELLAENSEKLRLRNALMGAADRIRTGGTLEESLGASGLFPDTYLSMVRAAERSGTLVEVMHQLASYLDREAELKGKLQKALAYPAFLIVLAVTVVTFLVVAIIPKFGAILEEMGVELPWATRALLGISGFISGYWPFLVGGVVLVVGLALAVALHPGLRYRLDSTLLRLPLIGPIVVKSALARLAYVLASLLRGGIAIVEALATARDTVSNRAVATALDQARKDLIQGSGIADALGRTGVFPSLVLQMVTLGEATGNLDKVLERVAELYDQQVDRATRSLIGLVEPALIVVLGVVVGFVAMSMVLPMVKAVSSIG